MPGPADEEHGPEGCQQDRGRFRDQDEGAEAPGLDRDPRSTIADEQSAQHVERATTEHPEHSPSSRDARIVAIYR